MQTESHGEGDLGWMHAMAPTYADELAVHGLSAVPRTGPPVVDERLHDHRMPAEWDVHERTLLAWPVNTTLWGSALDRAKRDYAAVARAVADFEPVTVIAPPGSAAEVHDLCGASNIDVLETPIDDSWIRDNGPLIVRRPDGHRFGVDFAFNAWGRKYTPYADDARAAQVILEHLGIERVPVDMVLEGGAITVDGEGTGLTTAQCLLHSSRNPHLSEADIVTTVCRSMGLSTLLMLPFGLADDQATDGHVDGVATFTSPGRAFVQACGDPFNVNHESMARNLRYLRDNEDAAGRTIQVETLSLFPTTAVEGVEDYVVYANFYVANGVVVVPASGASEDDEVARHRISAQFPDRTVVLVPGDVIALGGGGPHCITMQVPAAVAPAG
jgi:agmatine deiminase